MSPLRLHNDIDAAGRRGDRDAQHTDANAFIVKEAAEGGRRKNVQPGATPALGGGGEAGEAMLVELGPQLDGLLSVQKGGPIALAV